LIRFYPLLLLEELGEIKKLAEGTGERHVDLEQEKENEE
jgi:hypothetical protein